MSRCCGVVRSGDLISKTKYRETYTVHKSDVKMPQGWKEYTGEKNEGDRWDILRNALTARKLRKEAFSDSSTSDKPDVALPSSKLGKDAKSDDKTSKTQMFVLDAYGNVDIKEAPSELLHEAGRSTGAYNDETNRSKTPHKNRFPGSKGLK